MRPAPPTLLPPRPAPTRVPCSPPHSTPAMSSRSLLSAAPALRGRLFGEGGRGDVATAGSVGVPVVQHPAVPPGLILHTPHPAPRATRDNPADPAAREAGRLPGTRVHRSQRGCRRAAGAHVPRDAIRALWGSPLLSSGGSRLSLPCSPQPRSAVAQLSSWPRGAAPLPTCPLPDPKFLQHPAAHETSALGNQSASQGNLILSSFEVWPSARFTLCD